MSEQQPPTPSPSTEKTDRQLTTADFVSAIRKHKLLPVATIAHIEHTLLPETGDAKALAKRLINDGVLTAFQCKFILRGKAKILRIGGYVVQDSIGAGGMGEVYKATHRKLKRDAAIKILPSHVVKDQQAVQRFEREAEAAAQLAHPNIVATYDADKTRGIHYLVMEYVEGVDLAAFVNQSGPLPLEKAVGCVYQAARGLEYAHSQGIVHRDIKPQNLLIDASGTVKILDMGLARFEGLADGDESLTHTGVVMGTPDFMSPEQAYNAKSADARADIYSLGCTLFYLLLARPIYPGENAVQKLMAHREAEIPSLADTNTQVPCGLNTAFQKMVAKTPDERYQTMTEVLSALQEYGEFGSHTLTVPDKTPDRTQSDLSDHVTDDWSEPVEVINTIPDFNALEGIPTYRSLHAKKPGSRRWMLATVSLALAILIAAVAALNLKSHKTHSSPKDALRVTLMAMVKLDKVTFMNGLTGDEQAMKFASKWMDCVIATKELKESVVFWWGEEGWKPFIKPPYATLGFYVIADIKKLEQAIDEMTVEINGDTAVATNPKLVREVGFMRAGMIGLKRVNGKWRVLVDDIAPSGKLGEADKFARIATVVREAVNRVPKVRPESLDRELGESIRYEHQRHDQ